MVLLFVAQAYASECVAKKVAEGMTVEQAIHACYPKTPIKVPGIPSF